MVESPTTQHDRLGPVEWATAQRPRPGEKVCGDGAVAAGLDGAAALFAVLDGLGHGPEAAAATERGIAVLRDCAAEPLDQIIRRCHGALAASRGVAMTVARIDFDTATLSWLGIGNVAADLVVKHPTGVRIRCSVGHGNGIVGYQLPAQLRVQQAPIVTGDLLVMATDGIADDHLDRIDFAAPAVGIAEQILADHARNSDDALVLAARHRGGR